MVQVKKSTENRKWWRETCDYGTSKKKETESDEENLGLLQR